MDRLTAGSAAIHCPTGISSRRLAPPFSSTARTRRAILRGRAALKRADARAAETAGRWALSRLPDPAVVDPVRMSLSDRALLIASLELIAEARCDLADPTAAVHWHEQALGVLNASPAGAERDRERSIVLSRLGETLRLLGRCADAESRHRDALVLAESVQPADPVLVASALNGLGVVFTDTRRYAKAACTYKRALTLAEGTLGRDDPRLAGLLHNLAGLDHAQQRYRVGEPKALRALRLRVRGDGPNSTGAAADLTVLGALLLGQGRHGEAEAVLQRALAICQQHAGADHHQVTMIRHHLAALPAARGETRPAESRKITPDRTIQPPN